MTPHLYHFIVLKPRMVSPLPVCNWFADCNEAFKADGHQTQHRSVLREEIRKTEYIAGETFPPSTAHVFLRNIRGHGQRPAQQIRDGQRHDGIVDDPSQAWLLEENKTHETVAGHGKEYKHTEHNCHA